MTTFPCGCIINLWLNHNKLHRREKMTMALSLKALRVNAELPRSEVAKATGIHENTLANYENFVSIPDINVAMALASFYNCSVDDIKWSKE